MSFSIARILLATVPALAIATSAGARGLPVEMLPVEGGTFVMGAVDYGDDLTYRWLEGDEVLLETSQSLSRQESQSVEVPLARPAPGEITVDLSEAPGGWAVVLESLVPGWRARVNGVSTRIVPAQLAFMAVEVQGDSQSLRLAYQPASFRLGLFLSVVMGGLLLALLLRRR